MLEKRIEEDLMNAIRNLISAKERVNSTARYIDEEVEAQLDTEALTSVSEMLTKATNTLVNYTGSQV